MERPRQPVMAIVLAAGASSRFRAGLAGADLADVVAHKALARLGGESLVRRCVRLALKAGCSLVRVVVGAQPEAIAMTLAGGRPARGAATASMAATTPLARPDAEHAVQIELVFNPAWRAGKTGSVQVALRRLPPGLSGVLVMPADAPCVTVVVVTALIGALGGPVPGQPFTEPDRPYEPGPPNRAATASTRTAYRAATAEQSRDREGAAPSRKHQVNPVRSFAAAQIPATSPGDAVHNSHVAAPLVVFPSHTGRRGHPVGVSASLFDHIRALPTEAPLRDAWAGVDASRVAYVDADVGCLLNVNTPADLARARKWLSGNS